MAKKYVDLENARVDEQREVMERIIKDGVCPFCSENLAKYHKKPILREGEYWILTDNQWPYPYTKNHLLAITKEHLEHLDDLPGEAFKELIGHFQFAMSERNIKGGGIAIRFGDSDESGGTVTHLHAQLIQPDLAAKGYEPVRIKIGKSKK